MNKKLKLAIKIIIGILSTVVLVALLYLLYMFITYNRIEDRQNLTISSNSEATATLDTEYTIATQNLGFGAYTQDFTFFMDGGKESWAKSKSSVVNCINAGADKVLSNDPDIVLFQEVDTDSTRSYHVNQKKQLEDRFVGYDSTFAVNYHSSFIAIPITQPHGKSNSGIMTFSKFKINSALRRQLKISTGFSKFFDLDRCYSVSRIPTENGKELVVYNVHLSAYGSDDSIRTSQMTMLFEDMKSEYEAGNYCICGGDFNHDFTTNSTQILNRGNSEEFGWAMPFPDNLIPVGIKKCTEYTCGYQMPTARNCDIPYKPGNFTVIIDGFIVSENIEVTYLENIQTEFTYSDHNPVVMKFKLK